MTRCGYCQCDVVLTKVKDLFHYTGLHLVVAVGNDAIANLDIQRLNFQLLLNLIEELA